MLISKPAKALKPENEFDMISNLPDPILELILSSLPTTQIIQTSILSKRWRYLWTSVPFFSSLDIDCVRKQTKSEKKQFKEFMSWALENKSPLHLESFRLRCLNYYYMSEVGEWIHAAVTRKVKKVDLMYYPRDYVVNELPHCLVTCESLEVLRLFLFGTPLSLTSCTGFTSLRVLELNSVMLFEDHSVEEFFESLPLLEDLSLIDCLINTLEDLCISCPSLKTLRVDNRNMVDPDDDNDNGNDVTYVENEGLCDRLSILCPKLVFLEYAGHIADHFCFRKLDSLKKAVIYPKVMAQKNLSFESMGDTICELFASVSDVESLSLNHYFIQCIDVARDPKGNFPAFLPNLKILELTTTIDAFTLNVLIRILGCSFFLESLRLIIQEEVLKTEYWELDEVNTRRILTRHLKRVEFLEFDGEKPKMDIARLLLAHGNVLEEMVFSLCDKVKYNDMSTETLNQMSKFHKASSTVKVTTLLKA